MIIAAVILAGTHAVPASETVSRPHVVILLADDLGYGDCRVSNPDAKIPTPNLDRLARQGVFFSDAHSASATCTPSRYGLLTGINPARTGVANTLLKAGKPIIDPAETTLATLLGDQGYATAMVGKWHLGFEMDRSGPRPEFDFSRPLTGGPLDRGFEQFFGIHSSPGSAPYFFIDGRDPVSLPVERTDGSSVSKSSKTSWAPGKVAPGYVHEDVAPLLCDKAVEIIRQHAGSGETSPLFLYYAFSSPHAPWLPTKEFSGKSGVGVYGDFVMQLDHEVGRIVRVLEETGMMDNTLLIFTSDNGPGPESARESEQAGHDVAGGLRGGKAMAYEGGHRVPFIVTWPGRISPGSTSRSTINFTDLFATLAELLAVDAEKAYAGSVRDSFSFLSSLLDPESRRLRPPMVNTIDCIRLDDWKLVHPVRKQGPAGDPVDRFSLFDLSRDLSEKNDVRHAHPEEASRLYEHYQAFLGERRLK